MFNNMIQQSCLKSFFNASFVGVILIVIVNLGQEVKAQDLVLQDITVTATKTFSATNSITVGPNFTITNTGDATLNSPNVALKAKCVIIKGGKLQIISQKTVVDVKQENSVIPSEYNLYQNYPNPFNPSTKISYAIPRASHVTLKIYDILGNEITTLVNENHSAGNFEVNFNAGNFASGIYIYKITAGKFEDFRKMILLK